MSSSNLVNITKKRVLRQVSGEISHWFNQFLIDQIKRSSFIVFTFHKLQDGTSWRGPWRIEHEKI